MIEKLIDRTAMYYSKGVDKVDFDRIAICGVGKRVGGVDGGINKFYNIFLNNQDRSALSSFIGHHGITDTFCCILFCS